VVDGLSDAVLNWARRRGWLGQVLAGHLSARGLVSLPVAKAACTTGSLLGCLIWYALGRLINARRLEAVTVDSRWGSSIS